MNDITEVDRLNAKIADLKKTVEWLQGRIGITMGVAAGAALAAVPASEQAEQDETLRFREFVVGCHPGVTIQPWDAWLARAALAARQAPTEAPKENGEHQCKDFFDSFMSTTAPPGYNLMTWESWYVWQAAWQAAQQAHDSRGAARYRWLRDPANSEGGHYVSAYAKEDLDKAIDAAIAQEKS